MVLTKLSYSSNRRELKDIELEKLNLIVGKNATGKSTILAIIDALAEFITQKRKIEVATSWDLEFTNNANQNVRYKFNTTLNGDTKDFGVSSLVPYEQIFVNNEEVVKRTNAGEAQIKNNNTKGFEVINPPEDNLILHSVRDVNKYPYLEDLVRWAKNAYLFQFSNITNKEQNPLQNNIIADRVVPSLFPMLDEGNKESLIKDFNATGYSISSIVAEETYDNMFILYIKEEGIKSKIEHYNLSQGMYRNLSLLIFIEYLISHKKPGMILIDDFCEGLDYERAQKLGKLVFSKCKEADIQLIATSNDTFLMDSIELDYMNIITRTGNEIRTINRRNHPKLFEDFEFTGLSNFDFFSSNFIKKKWA
ncbi:MAG: ATP-binding protein [Chitinophagia bacterium]|nr:ATP-binding protein [Chitinophagia bacterium]